jgi:CO dehydrogenase/acetyl-CoA synthase delta subunit
MSTSVQQLRDSMRDKLDQLDEKVKDVKIDIEQTNLEREADIHVKVEQARAKASAMHDDAVRSRAKIEGDFSAKRAEWQGKVQDWKAERNKKSLDARADDAEVFASAAFDVAVSAVYEADLAILEAIEARQQADAVAGT